GKQTVLQTIAVEDFGEARSDQRTEAIVHYRVGGTFSRRAATEVGVGQQDFGLAVRGVVQRAFGTRIAMFVEADVVEERFAVVVPRTPMPPHVATRQDHPGVDLG